MNVRIIDPGRASALKPRGWGREVAAEDFGDLDDGESDAEATQERKSDDRFDLLFELRHRQLDFLETCLAGEPAGRLPNGARGCFAERREALRGLIRELERMAGDLGLEVPALPPVPAGRSSPDGPEMIAGALFLNSLGVALLSAFLAEGDAATWRTTLLPLLADDCRFEGRLKGCLEDAGGRAQELGERWLALTSGLKSVNPQRLWSFDLLRLGIRRLLGEGHAAAPGG
jgi:hypothetical protein